MSFEEDPAEDREADLWDSGDQLSLEELELENVA